MRRRSLRRGFLFVAVLAVVGCGEAVLPNLPDGGSKAPFDAGEPGRDAAVVDDGGNAPVDAGADQRDAGSAPVVDAGLDAGGPPPPNDAGTATDAGIGDAGATDAGPTDAGVPEPTWGCPADVPCSDVTTTVGSMLPLDACAYELALEAPLEDGEALADALLQRLETSGLGQRVTLQNVLANLNRDGVSGLTNATQTRLSGMQPVGFRWNSGDDNVDYWMPQGITGSSDAEEGGLAGGRRLLMVGWYHKTDARPTKGARVSLADITDLGDVSYRHLLLVDPVETASGPDFGPAEYDSGNALHVGGIVWYGRYLFAADTSKGLRVYDLGRIFRPSHTNDTEAIGISSGRSDAHGYLYAVPRVARFRLTDDSCPVRFAFAGLDRNASPPTITTGEYFADHPSGRMVVWPLDPETGLLETRGGTTRASAAVVIGQTRAQGGIRIGDDYYVSSSSQDGSNGRLYRNRPGQQSTSAPWVYGAEDLYFERHTNRLWTAAEHPGARDVVSIPRGEIP